MPVMGERFGHSQCQWSDGTGCLGLQQDFELPENAAAYRCLLHHSSTASRCQEETTGWLCRCSTYLVFTPHISRKRGRWAEMHADILFLQFGVKTTKTNHVQVSVAKMMGETTSEFLGPIQQSRRTSCSVNCPTAVRN